MDTIIGVDWPLIGPWINALLRRHLFSDGMLREWQRHQVEEVGLLPHFLPALYAQRNDRNIYRLAETGSGLTMPMTDLCRRGDHDLALLMLALCAPASAITVTVTDPAGQPLATVMVRERRADGPNLDTSDNGYQAPGVARVVVPEITRFSDAAGRVAFADRTEPMEYLVRKPGFQDLAVKPLLETRELAVTLVPETDPVKLAEARPASSWLGALDLGDRDTQLHFQTQCTFCHQQGNSFIRMERTPEEWAAIIGRMMRLGSRLSSADQRTLPEKLSAGYRKLRENPQLIAEPAPWSPALAAITITEWPLGDIFSQVHDMLYAANGLAYVADNIQDRLYEVNPRTNEVTVYRIPHREGERNGGLLAARLRDFPKHDSTSNAHSLAESRVDGHIFITPSAQRRLVEFDPATKQFTLHEMDEGFYPHTIRVDQQDRVWFTVALSNQVAMFDRGTSASRCTTCRRAASANGSTSA